MRSHRRPRPSERSVSAWRLVSQSYFYTPDEFALLIYAEPPPAKAIERESVSLATRQPVLLLHTRRVRSPDRCGATAGQGHRNQELVSEVLVNRNSRFEPSF